MSNQFVLSSLFNYLWEPLIPWVGEHILRLAEPITIMPNGSGDTTFNWVSIFTYLMISGVTTIIWSALDHKRPNYEKLMEWMVVLIRYYLIMQMINYGLAKLYYLQFQPPRLSRLMQTFGDASPMGLMWTFMGFSKGYTMFAGAGEFIGGILLLFRKTRTLGALVVFGIMFNVMMMNYCYDIPVKLLSTHLVLLSMVLLALDGKRLIRVFVLNKSSEPLYMPPHFAQERWQIVNKVVKWVVMSAVIGFGLFQLTMMVSKFSGQTKSSPLYGLYEVQTFIHNGDTLPPLLTDSVRWRYVGVEGKEYAWIRGINDSTQRYHFAVDTATQMVEIHLRSDTISVDSMAYHWLDSNLLELSGTLQSDTLSVQMRRKDWDDFRLTGRGFHWVNEYPYNR